MKLGNIYYDQGTDAEYIVLADKETDNLQTFFANSTILDCRGNTFSFTITAEQQAFILNLANNMPIYSGDALYQVETINNTGKKSIFRGTIFVSPKVTP